MHAQESAERWLDVVIVTNGTEMVTMIHDAVIGNFYVLTLTEATMLWKRNRRGN